MSIGRTDDKAVQARRRRIEAVVPCDLGVRLRTPDAA